MYTIERLKLASEIGVIADDWDRLASDNRMRSAIWSQTWLDCFGRRYEPYILIARTADGIQGIFPLALERSALRGRRLVHLGSGKACGDNLGILAAPGREESVASAMADWLALATGANAWDCIDLDGVQPSDLTMVAFQNCFQTNHSILVEAKSSESCWAIELDAGWDGFIQGLSKRMRRMVKNTIVADYLDSGRCQLRVATSLGEAQSMLQVTAAFHQSRWSDRNIDGCFGTEGFNEFLVMLIDRWWPTGIAYVATLELDGRTVAGGIGLWGPDELALYLVGMDIEAKVHRPGWLLSIESIRLALKLGKRRFNFLRGDEEYKARLGAKPTVQQRWLATSPRLLPRLRGATLRKGIEVRDWFRSRIKAVDPIAPSPSSADAST